MTYQHDYGQEFVIPIYTWYIEGADQTVLVDTGELSPIQSESREKAIGGKIYTFETGLARWNLTPADIDIIIHTHLHNDHCENDYKCENATIYVHEKELVHIHEPHPLDFRYLEDYIEDVEERGQLEVLTGDTEVLPGLSVMHTPVHTEGGMSVIVATEAGTAVISGFCVLMENFFPPDNIRAMEMEVIPPGTPVNPYQAYDIMVNIKALADILLPLHEPRFAGVDQIPDLRASP